MTYSLTGLSSMGTVINEESTKDANLFQSAMPGTNSTQAFVLDIMGTFRTITVDGVYTLSDGTISSFISELDALVNGAQVIRVYHSDKSNANYNVKVLSVKWKGEEGAPTKVDYTIEVAETST